MPLNLSPINSTDQIFRRSTQGISIEQIGPFYVQYSPTTAIANSTTETSLFNNSSTTTVSGGPMALDQVSSLILPANSLATGTIIRGYLRGIIANTGTPSLTTRAGFINSASTFTALATTGAVAMTTVSTSDYEVGFEFQVRSVGTSGVVFATVYHRYGSTLVSAASVTNTVDTTQQFTIDVRTTWSAASASNTQTIYYATVGVTA